MDDKLEKLEYILETMEIPELRKQLDRRNLNWMLRNLGIRNSYHPFYDMAIELIKEILNGNR